MTYVIRIQLFCALGLLASTAHASHLAQGTRIVTTMEARVQGSPSSSAAQRGTQPSKAQGTIKGGPVRADGIQWWQIDYGAGADGWTDERAFVEAYFPPPESAGGWRSLVTRNQRPSMAQRALIREKAGLDWDKLKLARDYSNALSAGSAVIVIRNGWIAGEWGTTNEINIASVTKSFTALSVAKLFELSNAGALSTPINPESFVYRYLPSEFGNSDPLKRQIKLKHFMTMSSGIQSADSSAFDLSLDEALTSSMSAAPGKQWSYVSLPVNLLSVIVKNVSGQSLQSFFTAHISGPIGALLSSWDTWAAHTAGGAGASMNARNLARIGYLTLHQGQWGDGTGMKQIMSPESISLVTTWPASLQATTGFESVEPYFAPDPESHQYYSHLFWTNRANKSLGPTVPADAYYMHGFKDNLCIVIPSLNMVVVRLASSGPGMDPQFHAKFMSRVVGAVVPHPGSHQAEIANPAHLDHAPVNSPAPIFLPDSAPIPNLALPSGRLQDFHQGILTSFTLHWAALGAYVEREAMRIVLGIAIFVLLASAFVRIRRRARGLSSEETRLFDTAPVFEKPLPVALLLSLAGSPSIFPEAPRLSWALLGALGLLSSAIILRHLVRPEFARFLYALLAFFFLDQLRVLAAGIDFWPRLIFLAEMFATMAFSLWLGWSNGRSPCAGSYRACFGQTTRFVGYVALIISSTAFISDILGYATFAHSLGDTLLQSAYLALLLYALIEILDGLVTVALSLHPLAALGISSRHRSSARRRVRHALQTFGVLLWLVTMLKRLWLREHLFSEARQFLSVELSFGSIHIAAADLLTLGTVL